MLVVLFVGRVCSCGGSLSCGAVCRCVLGTEAVIFLLAAAFRDMFRTMPFSFLSLEAFSAGNALLFSGIRRIRYRKPLSLVRAMCANIRKYPGIGTAIEWGGETWVLTKKISGVLDYYRVISYLCRMELRYGVMVALQILVLPAQVRILVPQRFLEK